MSLSNGRAKKASKALSRGDKARAEAKSNGYDTKTMRKIVALRKMESHVRQEADALLDTYRNALGLA